MSKTTKRVPRKLTGLPVTMNVRLSIQDRKALIEIAERDDRSIGGVIRQAIRQYVAVRQAS